MQITSDLLIKRNKKYFKELSSKAKIDYIDAYMIGGFLGIKNQKKVVDFEEKEDEQNDISIPRSVILGRIKKLEFLWSVCYINEFQINKDERDFVKKVFETNDTAAENETKNILKIDRVQLFHQYALGGVQILFDQLIKRKENESLEYSDCISDLLNEYKSKSLDEIIELD